jgi:hypothetical protein
MICVHAALHLGGKVPVIRDVADDEVVDGCDLCGKVVSAPGELCGFRNCFAIAVEVHELVRAEERRELVSERDIDRSCVCSGEPVPFGLLVHGDYVSPVAVRKREHFPVPVRADPVLVLNVARAPDGHAQLLSCILHKPDHYVPVARIREVDLGFVIAPDLVARSGHWDIKRKRSRSQRDIVIKYKLDDSVLGIIIVVEI